MLISQLGPRGWRIEAWVKVAAFNRIADADNFADTLKMGECGLVINHITSIDSSLQPNESELIGKDFRAFCRQGIQNA